MDFFFQLSERHAKEVIQFDKDRQQTWDNLVAKHKGHENIPSQENQQFRQTWGQKQKDMTARQFNELSNIVELEKEQKAREQEATRKKTDDLEIKKTDIFKDKEGIQKAELEKQEKEMSEREKDKLNEKLLPDSEKAEKAMEARAMQAKEQEQARIRAEVEKMKERERQKQQERTR